jgi:hypothetical protein
MGAIQFSSGRMINCHAESEAVMSTEELKAKLMGQAEAIIDGILAKKKPTEQMTLEDIVALALESGQQVEAVVLKALSNGQADEGSGPLVCAECGGRLHYKGKRGRDVVTAAGELRLERAYYYCTKCKVGRFPPR